jgi:CHAD domain-containing protein
MKSWLQNLADMLGEVRDLDVLLVSLKQQQNNLSAAERLLLANLLERLRRQRQRRFQALLHFFAGETYATFRRDFPRTFAPQTLAAAA